MAEFLFSNFGQSTLARQLLAGHNTAWIDPSDVGSFPVPEANQVFSLVFADGRQEPEICWCTLNYLDGALAILRGREDTPQGNWAVGTSIHHTHTAAALEWFVTGGQIVWKSEIEGELADLQAQILVIQADLEDLATATSAGLNFLETKIEQNYAAIGENWSVVSDYFLAQATVNLELEASIGSTSAELTEFKTVQVTNNEAQAAAITAVEATSNTASANASTALEVSVEAQEAVATLTTTVSANYASQQAQITNVQNTATDNYNALASNIVTVSAAVDDVEASVTVTATALADLTGDVAGFYGVKVAAGNVWGGLEIMVGVGAGTTVNDFIINTGNFIIKHPGGNQFAFVYNAGLGLLQLNAISVNGAYIQTASIQNAAIANAAITSAKIGNLEVNNANINGSAVTTDKILSEAVTRGASAVGGNVAFGGNGELYCVNAGMTTRGGRVQIAFSAKFSTNGAGVANPSIVTASPGILKLYLNGGLFDTWAVGSISAFATFNSSGTFLGNVVALQGDMITVTHSYLLGAAFYDFQFNLEYVGGTYGVNACTFIKPSINLLETLR